MSLGRDGGRFSKILRADLFEGPWTSQGLIQSLYDVTWFECFQVHPAMPMPVGAWSHRGSSLQAVCEVAAKQEAPSACSVPSSAEPLLTHEKDH